MPLYIRDNEVDALAVELQARTGARSKTEAVRAALVHELKRIDTETPFMERIRQLQDQVAKLGERDPDFDQKKFSDEMWGDI